MLRSGLAGLLLLLELATLFAPATAARADSALHDYPVPGGWFYSQESRVPQDLAPYRGYTVVDDAEAAFWTGFRQYGGVEVLGYPVSRRYRYPGPNGFLQQAFQRGILQWRPELGQAVLANVFDMFSEQGLDDVLAQSGIPRPAADAGTPLSFEDDVARRMAWITEPQFLARYFWDPVSQQAFDNQEAAWQMFGLPTSPAVRSVYLRTMEDKGKSGPPLYLDFVAQRFQKGALELFLEDEPNDPTIVPGDGKKGCVTVVAAGRLARRLGSGKIIPASATQPEPPQDPNTGYITTYVPALVPGQKTVRFEMVGYGFEPGEAVVVRLTPPSGKGLGTLTVRVDATDPDGSFDKLIRAQATTYTMSVMGQTSHKMLSPDADPTLDLTSASEPKVDSSKSTYC
jgi:hypothetical protein